MGPFENLLNSVHILHTVLLYTCEDHVIPGGWSCEDHVIPGGWSCEDRVSHDGWSCEDHVTQGGWSCGDHVSHDGWSCEDHVSHDGWSCENHVIFGNGRAVVGGHASAGCVWWRRGCKKVSKQQADCVPCRVVSECCMGGHKKKEVPEDERMWWEEGAVGVILDCGIAFLH